MVKAKFLRKHNFVSVFFILSIYMFELETEMFPKTTRMILMNQLFLKACHKPFKITNLTLLVTWKVKSIDRTDQGGTRPSLFHLSAHSEKSRVHARDCHCAERWNNDGYGKPNG